MKLKKQVEIYAYNKEAEYNYQDTLLKNRKEIAFKILIPTKQESAQELIESLKCQ